MMFSETALSVWHKEFTAGSIATSSQELDTALSNGVPSGVITEFCGQPGSGKTQICHQLSVNVQLPTDLGGLNGKAVYIDTNRGFNPIRFREIASAQSNICQTIYRSQGKIAPSLLDKFLNGVQLYFATDVLQLLAVIHNLKNIITDSSEIRLIVIDSFSFLFRQTEHSENTMNRTRQLYDMLTDLQRLGDKFNCAIVITNELTTRIVGGNNTYFVPSMGDSHSHRVTQQITLGREDIRSNIFCANIDKSLHSPEVVVKFRITRDGIRGV